MHSIPNNFITMASVSIRAPKRKPAPSRSSTPVPVAKVNVKKEVVEVPIDNKKWSSYTLRAGDTASVIEGTRYNVMRFQASTSTDPITSMTRPIKLARRDLHEVPHVEAAALPEAPDSSKLAAAQATPEYSVAPHGGQPLQRKQFRKKTHEVFQIDEDKRQLRQEERFPWVMEDADGQQTFQGTLEGGQSASYVFLKLTSDGFEVTPLSKFYRFGQRQKYQTMSLDEAEEKMKKHKHLPRWVMKEGEDSLVSNAAGEDVQRQYRMRTTSHNNRSNVKAEEQEEELDFNEDFADDEEQHALVDDEEEAKEMEQRVKKEMLSANAIGDADPEAELAAEAEAKAKLDKDGRRVQRFLGRIEKNGMYESDSDSNPYESSSSSQDEDEKDITTSVSVSNKGDDDESRKQEKNRDDKIRESVNRLQKVSHTTYNTPNGSTLISRTSSSSNLSTAKADARLVRSRPHLVTLKLPKTVLSRFPGIPSTAPADKKKRNIGNDAYDSDRSQKKVRVQSTTRSPVASRATSPTQGMTTSASGSRAASPNLEQSSGPITVAELRSIVTTAGAGVLDMRGLLKKLKPKLSRDPSYRSTLPALLKESGIVVISSKLSLRN